MKKIFLLITLISYFTNINAQNNKKVIWDALEKIPIQYATIKCANNYAISNENGEFDIVNLSGILNIQRLGYQNIEINLDVIQKNDTIFMNPNVYQLEEVVVVKDNKYKKMINAILSDFALERHQETFFLRAVLKKNKEFYKIIDFSGNIEKKALFDVSTKPMPKKNYIVDVKNMRKVGFENRSVDFEMLSFETFLTRIATIYLSPKIYNFSNNRSQDNSYTKLEATPKDVNETKTNGYYVINNLDNSFNEVFIFNKDNNKSL